MRRREFLSVLGGAAAWPCGALGQQAGQTYRLGMLAGGPREAPPIAAFFDELRLNGFIDGQNLIVDEHGFGSTKLHAQVGDLLAQRATGHVPHQDATVAATHALDRISPF